MSKKYFLLFTICFFLSKTVNAGHNRGMEVTYVHLGMNKYGFTITTCTKSSSPADRPYLEISWGDGIYDSVPRIQIIPSPNGYDGQQNIYYGEHTFPGPGIYSFYVFDANRVQGIINIPGSINEPICVNSSIIISPFTSPNNSVQFSDYPCPAIGCVGQTFCYQAQVSDPDNDSLSFELITCKGEDCDPIGGYQFPNAFGGTLTLDSLMGEICWDAPALAGDYNIALKITEWRHLGNGQYMEVGNVIRDMQITIYPNCATMGLEENSLTDEFSVYPNPAQSVLSILSTINNKSEIKIFSSTGKLVYEGTLNRNEELDISNWSNGLYFISIHYDDKIWSQKFIKD